MDVDHVDWVIVLVEHFAEEAVYSESDEHAGNKTYVGAIFLVADSASKLRASR